MHMRCRDIHHHFGKRNLARSEDFAMFRTLLFASEAPLSRVQFQAGRETHEDVQRLEIIIPFELTGASHEAGMARSVVSIWVAVERPQWEVTECYDDIYSIGTA